MKERRISVALPIPIAEDLAVMAVRSGVRPGEIIAEAVRQFVAGNGRGPSTRDASRGGSVAIELRSV